MGALNIFDRAEVHVASVADQDVGERSVATRVGWIGLGIVTAAAQLCWIVLLVYAALRWVS